MQSPSQSTRPHSRALAIAVLIAVAGFAWWMIAGGDPERVRTASDRDASPPPQTRAASTEATDEDLLATRAELSDQASVRPAAAFGTLLVRTVEAESGESVPAVGLTIEINDGTGIAAAYRSAVTDERGEATIDAMPSGGVHLRSDRGTTADVRLESSIATKTVVMPIPRGTDVEGQVVDVDGGPLPFASIVVKNVSGTRMANVVAHADAYGRFALRALPVRTSFVGAVHADHFPSTMEPITATADGRPMHVELRMRGQGASVTGIVTSRDGTPLQGAIVRIGGTYGELEIRVTRDRFVGGFAPVVLRSGADGSFEASGLATGEIEFLVNRTGFAPMSTMVTLAAGKTNRVELRLETGVRVEGIVSDVDRKPLGGVRVMARAFDAWQNIEATTGDDGRFALDGCEPARLQLVMRKAGYADAKLDVADATEPLHVQLRADRTVSGRLVDASDRPLANWSVRSGLLRSVRTLEDGRFGLVLCDGDGDGFTVTSPTCRVAIVPETVHAEDGLRLRVAMLSMPTASVRGQLVDADGNPRNNSSVALFHDEDFVASVDVDAKGAFRFEPLVPSTYRLKVVGKVAAEPVYWMPTSYRLNASETLDLGTLRSDPTQRPGTLRVVLARSDGVAIEHARGDVFEAANDRLVISMLLSASDGRTQALLPGAYRLAVQSSNAAGAVRSFRVSSGEETLVTLELEPAARRTLFFPWPMPAGFPSTGRVRYTVRDALGETSTDGALDAAEMPHRLLPSLASGNFVLVLECVDGRRFEGRFRIASASTAPVVVSVAEFR